MSKTYLILFCLLSALVLGSDFPNANQVEAALSTIPSYVSASETVKKDKQERLLTALKFAYSVTANQEFWDYLNKNWDPSLSLAAKQALMEKAKTHVLTVAHKKIENFLNMKNESGKFLLGMVLREAMPSNTATENYYEREKFIGEDGKLDFRIAEFGLNSSIPIEKRVAADPIAWADRHFAESPKERIKRQEEAQKISQYSIGSVIFSNGTSTHSTTLGSCGTPSSQAPAIRPETHGLR